VTHDCGFRAASARGRCREPGAQIQQAEFGLPYGWDLERISGGGGGGEPAFCATSKRGVGDGMALAG
jgi:hypothetical protein